MPKDTYYTLGRQRMVKLVEHNRKPANRLHAHWAFDTFNAEEQEAPLVTGRAPDGRAVPNCGTEGCVAGELPAIDPAWYFDCHGNLLYDNFTRYSPRMAMAEYFGLDDREVSLLFYPRGSFSSVGDALPADSPLDDVLDHIQKFLDQHPA